MTDVENKTRQELISEVLALRSNVKTLHEVHATICYDNMFQFVGLMDTEGKLLEVNPSTTRMSGGV